MARVFISYSSKNATVVGQIIARLRQAGIDVWVDHERLPPGTANWDASIRAGIAQATHVLYMASPDAVQSSYVLSELHVARDQGKLILPIWIAGDHWSSVMPLGFVLMQGIDARGPASASAMQKLVQELGSPPSTPPVPAALSYVEIPIPPSLHAKGFVGYRLQGMDVILPPLATIPAGAFIMGSDKSQDSQATDNELPQYTIPLPSYQISRYPLTVSEYGCFVRATKHTLPPDMTFSDSERVAPAWRKKTLTWEMQRTQRVDHPVVGISWQDALAYGQWLATITGAAWKLPTEAEWEKAARGTDGRIYPWGNRWNKANANTFDGGPGMTTVVGSYPTGKSPYECQDMAGNVWEWCSSIYKPYPYNSDVGREDISDKTSRRVLRGGSWYINSRYTRAAFRNLYTPDLVSIYNVGARLVFALRAGS